MSVSVCPCVRVCRYIGTALPERGVGGGAITQQHGAAHDGRVVQSPGCQAIVPVLVVRVRQHA